MTPALSRVREATDHEIVHLRLSVLFFLWGDSMNSVSMPRRHPNPDTLLTAKQISARWLVHRDTVYPDPGV